MVTVSIANHVLDNVAWIHFLTVFVTLYILINGLLNINFALRSKNNEMKNAYRIIVILCLFALLVQFFIIVTR